jgi:hypothetical protein
MNCSDVQPLLDLMIDGAISAKDCAFVLDHLGSCAHCQSEWFKLEELRNRFREIKGQPAIPVGLEAKITQKLKREDNARNSRVLKGFFRPALPISAMVAISLAFIYCCYYSPTTKTIIPQTNIAKVESILDARGTVATFPQDKLASLLGFELKYLPLKAWHLQQSAVCKPQNGSAIARFDFVNKESPDEKLTCYQAPGGTIRVSDIASNARMMGSKKVFFGNYRNYRYALWCQNDRDYLFVTRTAAKVSLEQIINDA